MDHGAGDRRSYAHPHRSPKGDPQRIVAGSRQNQATGNNRTLKGHGRIEHVHGSSPALIERGVQSSCRRRCPDAVYSRRAMLRSSHPQRATAIRKRSSERIGRTPLRPPARSSGVHDIRPSRLCGRILGRRRSAWLSPSGGLRTSKGPTACSGRRTESSCPKYVRRNLRSWICSLGIAQGRRSSGSAGAGSGNTQSSDS